VSARTEPADAVDREPVLVWNGRIVMLPAPEGRSGAARVAGDSEVSNEASATVPCADARAPATQGTAEAAEPV
jgi:hypothetical protein